MNCTPLTFHSPIGSGSCSLPLVTGANMTIRPADAGTGIIFHRIDMNPPVSIEAIASNVVNTRLSTTIGKNNATVSTIEHLMAALFGCGIDNAHIDIDGPEVPIMDGSAAPLVAALQEAGTKTLSKARKYLVVKKPVTVTDGDKKITLIPSRYFRISFDMRFNHPVVNNQFKSMKFDEDKFLADYAPARTFGFLVEVETLKANGLARGGSLDNAVVIGDDGILNEGGLRFDDEFVRHKILDSTGDFFLAGHRIEFDSGPVLLPREAVAHQDLQINPGLDQGIESTGQFAGLVLQFLAPDDHISNSHCHIHTLRLPVYL